MFPLLQSPMAVSFTPLQPTLGIAHGDLRLVCGCSAMETHFMKLSTNSACVDVASRVSLELGSESCNRRQTIFPRDALQLSAVPFCEFVWPTTSRQLLLLLDISTSQYHHLQLTGEALAGQKFDELTCWNGGIP